MRVKVCGITNLSDGLLCAEQGADILGFILYSGSRRYVTPWEASEIIRSLPAGISKVAVMVNPVLREIHDVLRSGLFEMIQLHGEESPGFCSAIPVPVIKAFRVHPGFDFSVVDSYGAAIPLFDTFSPEERGGTGKEFDHSMIPGYLRQGCILSGGISIENVVEAVRRTEPMCIDLSSSLELSPGRKDPAKVKSFFDLLRKEELIK